MTTQKIKHLALKSFQAIATAALIAAPLAAAAVEPRDPQALCTLIRSVANIIGGILIVVAVLVILIGAFYLLFGGGSEEAATKGRNFVIYGLVGVAVGLLAYSLPALVASILNLSMMQC